MMVTVVLTSFCSALQRLKKKSESFKSSGLQLRLHHSANCGLIFSGGLSLVLISKERQNFVILFVS